MRAPAALGRVACSTVALAPVLGLVGLAGPALGQISQLYLDDWELRYGFSHTSARLAAMGDVNVPVEDETNEINMWDYGQNVAGFLLDRDAWTGDFWGAATNRNRRATGTPSSGENTEGGLQISFRSYQRALGVEFGVTRSDFEDGVGIDFEKHRFTGPSVYVIGNQSLGEKAVLGAALRVLNEEDDVTARNALAIGHSSNRRDYTFGLVYYLTDRIDLGASLLLSTNPVTGVSEDALHRNKYEWERPATEFGLQAVYGAEGTLQAGGFVERHLLDGGEVVDVSWAREFLLNPSGIDLTLRVPVLNESFEETVLGSRWLYRMGGHITLGAEVAYHDGSYDVDADPTWSSFISSRNDDFTETDIALGAGFRPHARWQFAGELRSRTRDTQRVVFENRFDLSDDVGTVNLGAEYFWVSDLILRGGYVIGGETNESTERSSGSTAAVLTRTEFDRNRVTGGIGWAPRGGVFQIDLAVGVADAEATAPARLSDRTDGFSFVLSGRTILK